MLYICAAAHVLLAATLAVGSPLEVLESSYRRISSPTQASTGRSFYNARRAPYEILEQSFKFKDPVPQDAGTFASAIRSRLAENEEKIEIRRKIRPPQRLSSLRTRNTQLPVKTLTTKPPKMFVRTSTTKKPSGTTPILVRLTKGSTKPPSLFSSSQTNPIFLRSTSKSQVTPTTSSPIQILETSSRPLNSKPSGGAKNDPFTRSNFSPPSPRRLVNPTKPFRLHSQFRIPASVKQKRPTYMSGSMTINANEDLISTPFPFPDTVKSIRDVVKHLDNEPYQKSTFNTPPTISPTSAPDVAPVTVPMTRTSPPVVKITTKPGHSTTRQAATADRKKFTEWKSSDSEKRIPVTQGPSSPSNTRIQFEDVRPGEFGNPGAGSKVLPHPGAGNTALETLAGAGAVALMAYGISYALPLAAPLVLRRSGSSRESPISRFMNWLDISGSEGKKKRRKGVKKVYKNTSGYPMISVRNSTMLGPLNYDDYDDDYHTDYYEFGKTGQKITNYDDYDIEDIPTRYRSDFKGTIPYEDSSYPFPSKFNHMARIDMSSANDKKVTERKTDVQSPIKHIGSDYFSFGYDPTDGAIGDDPPNESAVFGKVTYEYDFTNTHINPAVVGTDVRSDFYGLSDAQSQLESKGEIPARGTFQQGAPVRAGAPAPPRSDRKPKPPQSSNFLSNIFGNIFSRRSNTGNVHPPQASRRAPQNLAPIRGSRIPPHGHPRTVVQSSENPSYSHRSIEMVNRAPPKGFPIHFSHPGASRTPTGARPRTDGDFFAKEETDRKDDIAVGGGGAILPSDLSKTGGGGIPLPPQSISSMNTRTRNKNSQYPSYVSLEQVNRLAEEEMEGVVRGYSRLHDAPWPPPEGSQIIEDKLDLDGAGSKVYLFDETDLKNGYHLNADSTDYIYKTNDNSYKNSPLSHGVETKPATLKTLAPDYNDFDYVDIKGSSADIDTQRSFSFPAAGSGKE